MSDERFDSRPGADPPGADRDETADRLRRALRSEAAQVIPTPDGLQRIRAAIAEKATPPRRLPRPAGSWRRVTPLLAAAAAAGVLAVAAGAVVRLEQRPAPPAGNGPTTTAALPTPGPTTPTPTGGADRTSVSLAPGQQPAALPVYVAAEQGGRYALFREFRVSASNSLDQRVSEALTDAVDDPPLDPDYTTLFSGGRPGRVLAQVGPDLITVQITAAMATNPQATRAQAEAALQQLVWTATAAAALPATPVRVLVLGGPQQLFGLLPLDVDFVRGTAGADPRAPVWITSLADDTTIGRGTLTVTGDGVNQFENTLVWTLSKDGVVVARGNTSPLLANGQPPVPGQRGSWSIQLDVSAPGSYELVMAESTGDPSAVAWQDTKTFRVN